jgi:peptidoglycan hydrolase-like protein with peptidoglycan-binding domain
MKLIGFIVLIVGLLWGGPALADAETYAIQGRLKVDGYYPGKIDGIIGDSTKNAIRAFQAERGLPTTGHVGPKTYKALFGRERRVQAADDYQPVDLKANLRDNCVCR